MVLLSQDLILKISETSRIGLAMLCDERNKLILLDFKGMVKSNRDKLFDMDEVGDAEIIDVKETMTTTMIMIVIMMGWVCARMKMWALVRLRLWALK